jgi:hypothetical protein
MSVLVVCELSDTAVVKLERYAAALQRAAGEVLSAWIQQGTLQELPVLWLVASGGDALERLLADEAAIKAEE